MLDKHIVAIFCDEKEPVMSRQPDFIGIDWGTSSFRAFLLTQEGRRLDQITSDAGIKRIPQGAFPDVIDSVLAQWPSVADDIPIIMCGMIGSAQGWYEVPYITQPELADVAGLAAGCVSFFHQNHKISIMPGLALSGFDGVVDVMRGEETLHLGATASLSDEARFICLPGTHSKWIGSEAGRIASFATFMTGEMFELATSQSMLAPVLTASDTLDMNAFTAGLARAENKMGILNQLFSVRAEIVTGKCDGAWGYSLVSGIIIGTELQSVLPLIHQTESPAIIVASGNTQELYQTGCSHYGITTSLCDATDAVIAGLAALYRHQITSL